MRVLQGLSQRKMAEAIGIAHNALANAEDGAPVRLRTAQRICGHYERELHELFPEAAERLILDVPAHTGAR
jgi:transcriptional regulator with XRE-family HTH domain